MAKDSFNDSSGLSKSPADSMLILVEVEKEKENVEKNGHCSVVASFFASYLNYGVQTKKRTYVASNF